VCPKLTTPLDQAKAYEVVWDQVAPIFEASRRIQNPSFVYLIGEEEGPVKIGVATNPVKRLRTMQTGNPRRLRIEWVLVGDGDLEKMLHKVWQSFGIWSTKNEQAQQRWPDLPYTPGTEWFQPEVREKLVPVIQTAIRLQVEHLKDARGDVLFKDLGALVIEAHQEHDFVFSHDNYGNWEVA
jgi:hypothetical protein